MKNYFIRSIHFVMMGLVCLCITAGSASAQYSSTVMSLFTPDPSDPHASTLIGLDPFSVSELSSYTATTTSCADVRSTTSDGIAGDTAGFETEGESCFSGGGQSYCFEPVSYTFECAGVQILGEVDIAWAPYDLLPEDADLMTDDEIYDFYKISTRDTRRGRAGHTHELFMNAHGICRAIDNTSAGTEPVFMSVQTPAEWRTVHGVPAGGDPNAGYAKYSNRSDVEVDMAVCCAPILTSVCGVETMTGYAKVGETVQVFGNGGLAEIKCIGNNQFEAQSVIGICGGYGSDGGGGGDSMGSTGGSTGGYANPSNGGTISASDWGGLSADAQASLSADGYGPSSIDATNATGVADCQAAEAQAAADAEAKADSSAAQAAAKEAEAAAAAAEAKAEAEAAQAAEDAEDDDDDDDD